MIFHRDVLHRVICNIRTPQPNGAEEVGTGMFVVRGNELFLITASHVARPSNANTYLVLSDDNGNAATIALTLAAPVSQWDHHPAADIAKIHITITQANQHLFQNRFYPHDQIHIALDSVSRDVELTTIGFPLGLGAIGRFSPLSFRTYAASSLISLNRADNQQPCDFFVLESPSVGGYSGGPVFDLGYMIVGMMTQNKGKTICYGFMHGTISDNTGGKLAAVTPASYLDGWL